MYAATVPGVLVVPVTELKRLQLVPSVDTATQAAYLLHSARHDWRV